MEYFVIVVVLLFGMGLGIFIGMERMRKAIEESSVGHLRIDRSEPDEAPKTFFEVTKGVTLDDIANKKFVILKVINKSYISQN